MIARYREAFAAGRIPECLQDEDDRDAAAAAATRPPRLKRSNRAAYLAVVEEE